MSAEQACAQDDGMRADDFCGGNVDRGGPIGAGAHAGVRRRRYQAQQRRFIHCQW